MCIVFTHSTHIYYTFKSSQGNDIVRIRTGSRLFTSDGYFSFDLDLLNIVVIIRIKIYTF